MTAPTAEQLAGNALLMTLDDADRQRLRPHLLLLDLAKGAILQESGEEVVDTWFPCAGAIAGYSVATDPDNNAVEVAVIGREGAIGGIVSNGSAPSFATATVRIPGPFMRVKTVALEQAKLDSISLRHWFARYSDCLLAQVFQTAACNARHTITQRTAKWLLAALARTSRSEFELTQEQLAEMLGVGRTFVTRTLRRMREQGLVATRRGVFIITDEAGLRATSCACTTAIENHFDAVLHGIYPVQ